METFQGFKDQYNLRKIDLVNLKMIGVEAVPESFKTWVFQNTSMPEKYHPYKLRLGLTFQTFLPV